MFKTIAAVSLGAVIALAPLAAYAETDASPSSSAAHAKTHHNRSPQHSRDTAKQRARASAEHLRKMRHQ